jgi:hypothetical protein
LAINEACLISRHQISAVFFNSNHFKLFHLPIPPINILSTKTTAKNLTAFFSAKNIAKKPRSNVKRLKKVQLISNMETVAAKQMFFGRKDFCRRH